MRAFVLDNLILVTGENYAKPLCKALLFIPCDCSFCEVWKDHALFYFSLFVESHQSHVQFFPMPNKMFVVALFSSFFCDINIATKLVGLTSDSVTGDWLGIRALLGNVKKIFNVIIFTDFLRATAGVDRICSFWRPAGLPEKEPWT